MLYGFIIFFVSKFRPCYVLMQMSFFFFFGIKLNANVYMHVKWFIVCATAMAYDPSIFIYYLFFWVFDLSSYS